MNMFNNNNDDDDDEESTSGRIRKFLQENQEEREQMYKHPIYKQGFLDGEISGRMDANLMSRMVIRGMFQIFDDKDDPPVM